MNSISTSAFYYLEAPAKVNLTLDVLGKRDDGYHELVTVMHQINLVDKIHLARVGVGIEFSSNSALIPNNEKNLAYQAARLMAKKYALGEGIKIYLEKNIPVGAGLAGGSTDAAAVIIGINELYGLKQEMNSLLEIGAQLGSDVPFCIMGGTALARGRGEILCPLSNEPELQIVLVKPDFQISTRDTFQAFRREKIVKPPDTKAFLAAWDNCDMINIAREMNNVLETVSLSAYPEITAIKQQLLAAGALNAVMSGSGPSVVALFSEPPTARAAFSKISQQYQQSFIVSSYRKEESPE